MDMQFILNDVLRIFTDDSLILVPCLYVILWTLKKTPVLKKTVWLYTWIILALGAAFSVLLNGFSFYHVLRGFLAAGISEYVFYVNDKKNDIKCLPDKRKSRK